MGRKAKGDGKGPAKLQGPVVEPISFRTEGHMTVETSQPKLTPRELEVAALLAQDWSIPDIASLLSITRGTVYDHIDNIALKLGCRSSRGIAVWYVKQNIPNL